MSEASTGQAQGQAATKTVCRKVVVPELRRGAEIMHRLFS
jgi:hypothetical protein